MRGRDLPIVGWVRRSGADDPVLDTLLVTGGVLVVSIGLLGRSAATEAMAGLYLLAFAVTVLKKGVAEG